MARSKSEACWQSDLRLHIEDDETESKTEAEDDDIPDESSVGPFMCRLFEKQLYTDVDFVSKNTKELISAHRVVLAAKCNFFKTLLFDDQKNFATGIKMQVEISNLAFNVFKDILKYFYTGDIDVTGDTYVLDLNAIAQSFQIHPLIDRCEEYIDALELTEDNACSTLQVSNTKNAERMKNRCIDYIKKNTSRVISSPDFEKCSYSTVREICDLQDLNLKSEVRMLEAVQRWINVQPKHAKEELTKSLMKCIRFLSFTPKEFSEVVKQHPELLPSTEALTILMHLNDPKSKNVKELPGWINRSHRTFARGFQRDRQNRKGSVKIPLKPASKQQDITEFTSVLQMKCIKGDHIIQAIKFALEDIPNQGNMTAVLIINALVLPKRHQLCFSKIVNSKDTTLILDRGIFVRRGQTLHLKVEIKASHSCKFLQFDDSKIDNANEHFECSLVSNPKHVRLFIIEEIIYSPHVPHFPLYFRRKKYTNPEENHQIPCRQSGGW